MNPAELCHEPSLFQSPNLVSSLTRHLEPQRRKGQEGKQETAMRTTFTLGVNIVIEARH
jgi:hypothetical protein